MLILATQLLRSDVNSIVKAKKTHPFPPTASALRDVQGKLQVLLTQKCLKAQRCKRSPALQAHTAGLGDLSDLGHKLLTIQTAFH